MKKRPLLPLALMDLFTLGFYELYWLYTTRNEMVNKGIRLPSAWWLLMAKTIQIGCVLFTAYAVLYAIPANNRRNESLSTPTPECLIQYAESSDSARVGTQQAASPSCKNQTYEYYKGDNTVTLLKIVFGLYVISFVLLWLTLKRWYVPYAEAVAKVTNRKLSSVHAVILLVVVPSPWGMLAIQDAYNKS